MARCCPVLGRPVLSRPAHESRERRGRGRQPGRRYRRALAGSPPGPWVLAAAVGRHGRRVQAGRVRGRVRALGPVAAGLPQPGGVALRLAGALGVTVEELFGPGSPPPAVAAQPVAPLGGPGSRVALAPLGESFVALPLSGDSATRAGFQPAGGLVAGGLVAARTTAARPEGPQHAMVRPLGPPRPTLVVAGCDPALPLLETPLSLLHPPVPLTWWSPR